MRISSLPENNKIDRYFTIFIICTISFYFLVISFFSQIISIILFIALPLLIIGLYLVFKYPFIGIIIMVIGTSLDVLGRLPGLIITPFHIGAFFTISGLIFKKIYNGDFSLEVPNFNNTLLFFLMFILFSLFYTPSRLDGFIYFIRIIVLVLIMYSVINVIDNKKQLYIILSFLIISSLLLSIISLKTMLTTSTSIVEIATNLKRISTRTAVTFENPNILAIFLLIALSIPFSIVINGNLKFITKIPFIIISLILIAGIVSTFSRAAWVSMIFVFLVIILFSKYKKVILIFLVITFIITMIFLYNHPLIKSMLMRIKSITRITSEASNSTRIFLALGGLNMFLDSKLIGVGYRGFSHTYANNYKPAGQLLRDVVDSHTLPVEILAELGIIGFSLAVIIFYRFFSFSIKLVKKLSYDKNLQACYIGILAGMVGFFIHHLFTAGGLTHNWLWIGFGLTYAIQRLTEDRK